jgi:hypothetical protein
MRKSLLLIGIPVSVVGLGLAAFVAVRSMNKGPVDSFAEELRAADAAGIQLAQTQAAKQFALNETAPEAKPEPKTVTKRGAGPKAIRSKTPSVKAAPEPVAAAVVEEIPEVSVMQTAMSENTVEEPAPAIARPSPANVPAVGSEDGAILRGGSGAGSGRTGAGSGGGWGTIFGAVIRGGGVDGDNCDPRGARRYPGSGSTSPTPIYGRAPGVITVGGRPNASQPAARTPATVFGGASRGRGR